MKPLPFTTVTNATGKDGCLTTFVHGKASRLFNATLVIELLIA